MKHFIQTLMALTGFIIFTSTSHANPDVKQHEDWYYWVELDDFDDTKLFNYMVTHPKGHVFYAQCQTGTTVVVFKPKFKLFAHDTETVLYRIDKKETVKSDWQVTSHKMVGIHSRPALELLKQLPNSSQIALKVGTLKAKFDVQGADFIIKEMTKNCGWK